MKRNKGLTPSESDILRMPREPGVGAELTEAATKTDTSLPDFHLELEKCEFRSLGSVSGTCSSAVSEKDENEDLEEDLNELKQKFKELAVRPVDGGEGKSTDEVWESELKSTVDKLDHMMLMKECSKELSEFAARKQESSEIKITE